MTTDQIIVLCCIGYMVALAFLIGFIANSVRNSSNNEE